MNIKWGIDKVRIDVCRRCPYTDDTYWALPMYTLLCHRQYSLVLTAPLKV
jgi:hypothetical protein